MEVRINKYLSEAGVCSRREADRLLEEGRITIDGVPAVMGSKVTLGQVVMLDGKKVSKEEETIVIAFNKPVGVVCTSAKEEKNNIIDYIGYEKRIYPVGRLDKESQGLILLTNDGEMMNRILKTANNHEKEYVVTVNKPINREFIEGMEKGVPILDTVTRKCKVYKVNDTTFRIILMQGLNRQIRRMCEYFGYKVKRLERIRIMNIHLKGIEQGKYRSLTTEELSQLRKELKLEE